MEWRPPYTFIPSAFLKHLVGQRCDKAILTSLTRKEWHVKVGRGDESLWFEEGWADFVEGHDIGVGEFLMFRHEGDMVFHVTIFGTSACERGPPPPPPPPQDGNHVNDFRGNTPKNGKAVKVLGKKGKAVKGVVGSAKAECSSFKATIYPSNLLRCAPYMIIPPAFVKHLVGERCDRAILKSSTGKSWEVKVGGGEGSLWLEEGWLDFVSEHDISVGELLVFRYDGNMTFHVTIFGISTCERHQQPFAEMGTKDDGKKSRVKDEKQIEDSKGCIDMKRKKKATKLSTEVCPIKPQIENPHFKVTLCPSNLRRGSSYLHIPLPFCRANNISHIKKMTLFDPKGRTWPVKVSHGRFGWSGFYSGWYEFSAMNSLKVGDECIFRLNKEEKAMDVSITRG